MSNCKNHAAARFLQLETQFQKDEGLEKAYHKFMEEYLKLIQRKCSIPCISNNTVQRPTIQAQFSDLSVTIIQFQFSLHIVYRSLRTIPERKLSSSKWKTQAFQTEIATIPDKEPSRSKQRTQPFQTENAVIPQRELSRFRQ